MGKEALKKAPEEVAEEVAESKLNKIPGVKTGVEWMKGLKPKAEPMLTAPISEMGELAPKSEELLSRIVNEMEDKELAELISKLYNTLTSKKIHVNPSDAAGIITLIGKLYHQRPEALHYLKLENEEAAEFLVTLLKDKKLPSGKLEGADALNIFTIMFNEKAYEGKKVDSALKSVEKMFGVEELSVIERAAFFKELYRRNLMTSEQILTQKGFQQGKILAMLGLDIKAIPAVNRVFQNKLVEAADSPEKFLFSALTDETTIKEMQKYDPDLAKYLREVKKEGPDKGWKHLKKILISMGESSSEIDAVLKQLENELKSYKIFSEIITPVSGEALEISEKEAKYYTKAVAEGFDWAGALKGKAKKGIYYTGGIFFWPAYKAIEIPKTKGFTKGKLAKAGWWILQIGWIVGLGATAYYGIYKPMKSAKKAKKETKEKIRKELEDRGATSISEATLEFLASEGAPIWDFIGEKAPSAKTEKYPNPKTVETKLTSVLKDPTKGKSYFNYGKIDEFVAMVQDLKSKSPGKDYLVILNDNFEKFISKGFFMPEGFSFVFSFCKDFGLSSEVAIKFIKKKDHFLWLYSALYNGVIPRSSIPVNPKDIGWVVELEDKFSEKYAGEKILAPGSLMDLLDQYTALEIVGQDFFDKALDNHAVLNNLPLAENEIVYGDITKLVSKVPTPAFEGDVDFATSQGEILMDDARNPSKNLPYFIAPKNIMALDYRFLNDVKAVKFVLEYSPGGKGLITWLEGNAGNVKVYEFVRYLMSIENLVKSKGIANLTKKGGWLDKYINSEAGKKYIAMRSKSITPKDFFPKVAVAGGEEEKAPKKKKKGKKAKITKTKKSKPKKTAVKEKPKAETKPKPKPKPKKKAEGAGGI